jgi:hypothetical protein
LDSKDEAERGRLPDEFILAHSAPPIRTVLRQIVSDIPSHGLNDKEVVEMAAYEEFRLLGRRLAHADDYP